MPRKPHFEDPTFDDGPQPGEIVPYAPADESAGSSLGAIVRRHEARLLAIAGVKSIGESRGAIGDPAIEIGIADPSVAGTLPRQLDGIEVVTRVVGEVEAYGRQRQRRQP